MRAKVMAINRVAHHYLEMDARSPLRQVALTTITQHAKAGKALYAKKAKGAKP